MSKIAVPTLRRAALALILILGLVLPGTSAGQKTEITTENGITVVHNPKKPVPRPGGPSQLILHEDLVIGKEPTPSGYQFAELRSVGADDQGNIWTLDPKDAKVRVFDKTGKLISTFGKKGQGPGEWELPGRMIILPDGTAAIKAANKLTFYSLDGRCLKEISTAKTVMTRFRIDSKGTIFGDRMEYGSDSMKLKLVRYDQSMNSVATLAEVDEPFKPGAISPFPILLLCHVTGDDRLIWMANSIYAFHVLGPEGRVIKTITKDTERVKITAADRKTILDGYKDNPSMQSQIVIPDLYPPVAFFIGDAEGRLYAQTYIRDAKGWLWYDVFDPEGRCITGFFLPKEETPMAARKDKLYILIQEDPEGLPLVKRYAMEWK